MRKTGDEVKVIDPGKPYDGHWCTITRISGEKSVVIQHEDLRYEISTSNILGGKEDMIEPCNCDQALNYKEMAKKLAKNVVEYCNEFKAGDGTEYLANHIAPVADDILKLVKEEDEYIEQQDSERRERHRS